MKKKYVFDKDPYRFNKEYQKKHYINKSLFLRKEDNEILNQRLKEDNIKFRELILNFLREKGYINREEDCDNE